MQPLGQSSRWNVQIHPSQTSGNNFNSPVVPVCPFPPSLLKCLVNIPPPAPTHGNSISENISSSNQWNLCEASKEEELSEMIADLVLTDVGVSYVAQTLSRDVARHRRRIYEVVFSKSVFNAACTCTHGFNIVLMLIENARAPPEHLVIRNALRGRMAELCLTNYGSRVVQEAIRQLRIPTVGSLVMELDGSALKLVTNCSGSHAIEIMVATLRPLHYGFVIDEITESKSATLSVICDKFGCRVMEVIIQELVDDMKRCQSSVAHDFLCRLVNAVVGVCDPDVVSHEYANFVVQKIISMPRLIDFADTIINDAIRGNVLVLSQKKHGSHVIQTVLRQASTSSLHSIIREIFDGYNLDAYGRDALDVLMLDGYGNYVIQTMLDVTISIRDGRRAGLVEWFDRLSIKVMHSKENILKYSSGRKLINTLKQISHRPLSQRKKTVGM